jgi:hypothetical protein
LACSLFLAPSPAEGFDCVDYGDYLHWDARLELPAPASFGALAAAGDHVYVADLDAHLVVVDVADPEAPRVASRITVPGQALDVAVGGDHAYIAGREAGLVIVDISDPGSPAVVASLDTLDWALGVALEGSYAYVTDRESGISIVDVSRPRPVLAGPRHAGPHRRIRDRRTACLCLRLVRPHDRHHRPRSRTLRASRPG